MKAIRVTEDTHGKIMDMRDRKLKNAGQVVDDIMMRINDVKTAPVATYTGSVTADEPCKQCEQYKKELDEMKNTTVPFHSYKTMEQRFERKEVEVNEAIDENKELKAELVEAKQTIIELESVSDVVVLDEDNEILG